MSMLTAPNGFPGPALDVLWKNPKQTNWPTPISELAQNVYPGKKDKAADDLIPTATKGNMRSAVTSRWQLIHHATLGDQVYDWNTDAGETKNLISTPGGQQAAERLNTVLDRAQKPPPRFTSEPDRK